MTTVTLSPRDDLQQTINAIKGPATVYLEEGIYRQKTEICADNITIIGKNREKTVITYDDYAKKIHADGKEYNTFRTYTLCVTGENVKLENLTVENSNSDPRAAGQCVALSVNAKNFRAENLILKSMQDTLFLYPFPDDLVIRYENFIPARQLYLEGSSLHLFENCKIYGSVDFIFGCAEAYFKNCKIVSVYDDRKCGFVAAPAHSLKQESGFCFLNCDFTSQGVADGEIYLARPWRDFGKCAFINCRLGKHINPALFDKWNDTERNKTARFLYYGLDCDFTPAPVSWGKKLDFADANDIIKACGEKFKDK